MSRARKFQIGDTIKFENKLWKVVSARIRKSNKTHYFYTLARKDRKNNVVKVCMRSDRIAA